MNTSLSKMWELVEQKNAYQERSKSLLEDVFGNSREALADHDIIVFSHLRWEFVTQRPQHIVNRLAQGRKVLFIEEPIAYTDEDRGTARTVQVGKSVTVVQPHISHEHMIAELEKIVAEYSEKLAIKNPILWFYSPMFSDIIPSIKNHRLVVYDCMDELSAFKGASPELKFKERMLVSYADVVFTGGKSLFESKKTLKENVFCFPSSVDRQHFASAKTGLTRVPKDIANLPGPVVGFYGVVDERLDLDLLAETARLRPDVSFVVIGPVVKISESDLPQAANLHYLGGKKYEELPGYLKVFDIAMMPFAMNDATKFISPTKTLEFMAAGKPIISTPIYDVVRDYSNVVSIVKNAQDFSDAITNVQNESASNIRQREKETETILHKTSWDTTVQQMKKLMSEALVNKNSGRVV